MSNLAAASLRRLPVLLPIALAGLVLVGPASGAGSFDGSYRGNQTTLRSNNTQDCSTLDHPNIVIVVQDNHFTRRWGVGDLSVDIGPDGSFSKSVVTSDSRRLRNIAITGKITAGNFEADIGTDLCAAHLSLKKS
jgi:hypothetical protein